VKWTVNSSCVSSKALMTATMLRQKMKDTLCIRKQSMQYHSVACISSLMHLLLKYKIEAFTVVKM